MRKSQGLQAVLGTEDEYHTLAHEATLWRLRLELSGRRLGVHDLYHAFNGRRNGAAASAVTLTLTLTRTLTPTPTRTRPRTRTRTPTPTPTPNPSH